MVEPTIHDRISNTHKRVAWITQLGKSFIMWFFRFKQPYEDNLCFQKIAQVPGDDSIIIIKDFECGRY